MNPQITEVVLTGGPCGGKTSALAYVRQLAEGWGYRVLTIPEVATLFISAGLQDVGEIAAANPKHFVEIETAWIAAQRSMRRHFRHIAQHFDGKVLIISDRGEMDAWAYLGERTFMEVAWRYDWKIRDLRDSYKAVFHLVSAADGAEEHYTLDNNPARQEGIEQAVDADRRTQAAWVGTPHLRVIDNSTDFEGKLKRLGLELARVLGEPQPIEVERKFLLGEPAKFPSDLRAQAIEIEQIYLDDGTRIRRRGILGDCQYFLTKKQEIAPGVRAEVETEIDLSEFERLSRGHPNRVQKRRAYFVYQNQYFELDTIYHPKDRWCQILEIELLDPDDPVQLPPFLDIAAEVTHDPRYQNSQIAACH